MTVLMQHASLWMSATNETESKSQTLNTQSSSLKVVGLTYLSSADAVLSPVAVFDLEISCWWINDVDVNSVKLHGNWRLDLYPFCVDTFMWPRVNGNVLTNQIDIRSEKIHEVTRCFSISLRCRRMWRRLWLCLASSWIRSIFCWRSSGR